jgi:hypothetical protein
MTTEFMRACGATAGYRSGCGATNNLLRNARKELDTLLEDRSVLNKDLIATITLGTDVPANLLELMTDEEFGMLKILALAQLNSIG